MIKSSCHCGAVKLEIDAELPDTLLSCNCSICKRLGGIMSYYSPKQVKITRVPGASVPYVWGDKTLAMFHCATCGCMTHWESIDPNQQERMGVNARLFEGFDVNSVRIRHFDGADTWKFLD